jgi:hypothetical protein
VDKLIFWRQYIAHDMKYKFLYAIVFFTFCVSHPSSVLGQWSGVYGNEWINYGSKYVKLNVSEAGLYRVPLSSLPTEFSADHSLLQLWHRGKEVAILQSDSRELLFYAELNEGSSDSLLFRPASARMNPYQSFFSDQGVYFLTKKTNARRASVSEASGLSGTPESYSLHTEVKSLRGQFSFSTLTASPLIPNNSFYENINTWTGSTIYGDSAVGRNANNIVSHNSFSLTNYKRTAGIQPVLNLMVNGLHHGKHNVKVSVGKTNNSSDQKDLALIGFGGLGGVKREGLFLSDDLITAANDGVISLKSATGDVYDWFSLTYYTLTYPREVKMISGKSSYFSFPASTSGLSRIKIETTDDKAVVLDVSNPFEPRLLKGTYSSGALEMMVARKDKQSLRLFSAGLDQIKSLEPARINTVDLSPLFSYPTFSNESFKLEPQTYDYLIITSDTLKEAAVEYAKYRSSVEGGNYKTIVYSAKNIYNLFNYGEPSAVGVKRFVEYMLKAGIRDRHNLLLVGISVTAPDAAELRLKKDLPNEVPTIGDPGSDILLVSGLHGGNQDTPAIPVGRISAFNQAQVLNYLAKVKEFEADKSDRLWQKKVLHLSGGKTSSEINQLSSILRNLNPLVQQSEFGGSVKAFVKQSTIETERVDISNEVNEGVGVISYFGHGSPVITDLDMGKVSDVTRKFNNPLKYPLMYFNGCGVGNVYSGRSTITLSNDWLLSPNVGAIASIANSYNSYVSPTSKHLKFLYEELFLEGGTDQTIGRIVQNVALKVLKSNPDSYDITNIHQANLHGDPAVRLFNFANPDYSVDSEKPIIILSESSGKTIGESSNLNVGAIIENKGRYIPDQNVPIKVSYTYEDGKTSSVTDSFRSFSSLDTVYFSIPYSKALHRIQVDIDPENTVQELSKENNLAELLIDWKYADKLPVYPENVIKDVISPIITVKFNNKEIGNEEIVSANSLLTILLEDNAGLPLDRSLLDLYIKDCWSDDCVYQRINTDSYSFLRAGDNALQMSTLMSILQPGEYELLVDGKDKEGNRISSGYTIRFSIVTDVPFSITISPNPATDYVKFEMHIDEVEKVESIDCLIYNSAGQVVEKSPVYLKYSGKNSWYWYPKSVTPGLYIYQLEIKGKDQQISRVKGKFILL